jgi:predicted nucleotidyltransferase
MQSNDLEILDIVKVLNQHHVDYIVIGGVCAVLHGAPVATFDMDIVHSRVPENTERLKDALIEIGAFYRFHPKRIEPKARDLQSDGHHLFTTDLGSLDALGTIVDALGYEELLPHTVEMELDQDLRVRILTLEKLIEIKEKTGRDKDRVALPQLRRTLEERNKLQGQ